MLGDLEAWDRRGVLGGLVEGVKGLEGAVMVWVNLGRRRGGVRMWDVGCGMWSWWWGFGEEGRKGGREEGR